MAGKDGWQIMGQEGYLFGKDLYWRKYKPFSDSWEHDHCTFCFEKFADEDISDVLHEGFTTEDNHYWICRECYEDFKQVFQWQVKT